MISYLLLYLFIALGVSFVCSLLESTLMSTTLSYINLREEEGYKPATLMKKYKTETERPLAAILSLNTIANTVGASGVGMQMATCGPTSQWPNLAFIFQKAISNAKKHIYIQTPYFLPTENLLRTLQTAALAKVDVRIMLPRHSDSKIMTHASFSYIEQCAQAGIKFYLYNSGMLHSKIIIVDDEFSTVGSTNFDFRSFEHNFEGNMFMYSREVNAQLAEIFAEDQKECTRINISHWRKRPLIDKALESVLRLLSPIL